MTVNLRLAFWRAAVVAAALLFLTPSPGQPGEFAVRWRTDERNTNNAYVAVAGIASSTLEKLKQWPRNAPEWSRVLAVFVHNEGGIVDPFALSMAGEHVIRGDELQFRPQFPLARGLEYRAEFRPAVLPGGKRDQAAVTARFRLEKTAKPPPTFVTQIYPTAEQLPENVLKFYVYFSAPMSRGGIYDHIKLRDEAGREIELPFLQIDEELWDAEMKRLTLFIDPGRIKRGVLPLEEVGPALESGKRYELAIDQAWPDATGSALKATFRKRFAVIEPDREAIDTKQWRIVSPKVMTMEPVKIDFGKAVDHALALRLIYVVRGTETIRGKKAVTDNERVWQLTPGEPWKAGEYHVAVQTTIEDLAGNNIGKPFEVDLFDPVQRRLTNSVVKIAFEID
jgi:hypothetical protein